MIDFSTLPRRNKTYAGANGSKIAVMYENELYMLKFPGAARLNKGMSYANGCISEHLGSHIFEIVGIPAQETLLGTFTRNGKEKIVVACKDFTTPDTVIQDFASLKNTIIDSEHNGYGTELSDILKAMDEQQAIDPILLKRRFWDMFIVDALIGNWDRHNGNWGFLYNSRTDEMTLAPVFDCGSSLFPQADEDIMQTVLDDPAERDVRIFKMPLSGIKQDGQKINYYDFIYAGKNPGCNTALKRILPRIDMGRINQLVDDTPYISDLQKRFYKTMLAERREKILVKALQRIRQRENEFAR
ncbi:MAG: HipA domain-containing protein [Clostridia bacterium]|nr:HipA domain-containing protein [Clostridia bacterium]MBQ9740553.1 HipA domain-containing protein [Kiritimatiellia bacterium]